MNKGIFSQLEEASSTYPNKLSVKVLESFFADLHSAPKVGRQIKLYTGVAGMFIFNWMMLYGETLEVKHFHTNFERIKGIYISLFKKHGPYKLLVTGKLFQVFKGTVLIKSWDDVISQYLLSGNVNDPTIAPRLKEINNYLKKLEKCSITNIKS